MSTVTTTASDEHGETTSPLNIPVPDPSVMTTRQLQREIFVMQRELFGLRELMEVKLLSGKEAGEHIQTIIETRLDGMDKAIRLLQDTADKFPARIDEKITAVREVHEQRFEAMADTTEEKFGSIQTQFDERDVRTDQAAGAVKIAVDAALQAQKEAASEQSKSNQAATTKSEAATTKLIDAQATLITNLQKAFDDKIDDLKERQNRAEQTASAQFAAMSGSKAGIKDGWGYLVAGAGLLLALYSFNAKQATPPLPPVAPQVIYVPSPAGTLLPTTPQQLVPR